MVTKFCKKCKSLQPINNFYFASKRDSKDKDENDPKARRNFCIPCWDEVN